MKEALKFWISSWMVITGLAGVPLSRYAAELSQARADECFSGTTYNEGGAETAFTQCHVDALFWTDTWKIMMGIAGIVALVGLLRFFDASRRQPG
jgi:hypothetical protein